VSCGDFRDILFPLTSLHSRSDGSATGQFRKSPRASWSLSHSNGSVTNRLRLDSREACLQPRSKRVQTS
jgi:hypothetical protein